jgi:hypothetical protein
MAETLTVGQAYLISWVQGWQGIGEKYNWPNVGAEPKFMDLFVVSFNSDAYINVIKEVSQYNPHGNFSICMLILLQQTYLWQLEAGTTGGSAYPRTSSGRSRTSRSSS